MSASPNPIVPTNGNGNGHALSGHSNGNGHHPPTRRHRRDLDRLVTPGEKPLEDPAREAVARWLATPKKERGELGNHEALCRKLGIHRQTLWRWKTRTDVLERAMWLLRMNRVLSQAIAQREFPDLVEEMARRAVEEGSVEAAKFVKSVAYHEEDQADAAMATLSLKAAIIKTENSGDLPSHALEATQIDIEVRANGNGNGNGNGSHE